MMPKALDDSLEEISFLAYELIQQRLDLLCLLRCQHYYKYI